MKGKVYLVGGGPGNEGLITRRGLDLIRKAEVLVYDRLAGGNLVKEAKEDCEMIYVGKKSSNHVMKQEDIDQVLVDKALENKMVVRLKGGDPYVFGRGGEEGIKLFDNNIPFEVVPGISSSIGGLCYAGIPITHRGVATSFHVITGHLKEDSDEHDWEALSRLNGTMVFLMGMSNLDKITKKLIENGKSKDTPVGIVHWASHPDQVVVEGNLENIVEEVKKAKVSSPSLIVVGDVVRLRSKLNFFENRVLHNKEIIITRASTQSSKMVKKISELGGVPLELPMIKINKLEPLDEINLVMKELSTYNYLVFTSMNGINRFFEELENHNLDTRALYNMKIVCVGEPTRKALKEKGLNADIIPDRFVSEGIIEKLLPILNKNDKLLIPRAKNARPLLVEELSKVSQVKELKLYETVSTKLSEESFDNIKNADYITFTSASTVKYFIESVGKRINEYKNIKIISIGPITSKEVENNGLEVYKEASSHTIDGIIEVITNEETL